MAYRSTQLPRLLLITLTAVAGSASSDQARAPLSVSARVVAIARLELTGQEPELLVTAADLDRGYIAPDPLTLTVYSNSKTGYALDVLPLSPLFTTVSVEGFGPDVRLPANGGTVTQRWTGPQTVSLALKFNFVLADGLTPGRYPWPLRLAARPLDQ